MLESSTKDESTLPLLCAFEDCFQLYDVEQEKVLSSPSTGENVNPFKGPTRLNDGRVDPSGKRFVSGGFNGDLEDISTKVFSCSQDTGGSLKHVVLIDNVQVTNSICWSVDGTKMYFADSPTKQIHSFDYDSKTGSTSNKTLLHTKEVEGGGVPDGSVVDANGFIWNAVWRGGYDQAMVHRIDPRNGEVVYTVHMPDGTSQVTCCCWGGKNMDILFITSAAKSVTKEPHAGGLYALRLPFKGKKEARLRFR